MEGEYFSLNIQNLWNPYCKKLYKECSTKFKKKNKGAISIYFCIKEYSFLRVLNNKIELIYLKEINKDYIVGLTQCFTSR